MPMIVMDLFQEGSEVVREEEREEHWVEAMEQKGEVQTMKEEIGETKEERTGERVVEELCPARANGYSR